MKLKSMIYKNPIGFLSSFLFLAFSIPVYFQNKKFGIVLFVSFCFIFGASFIYSALTVKATLKYVKEINKTLGGKGSDIADELPIPGLIAGPYGDIVWYNEAFLKTFITEENKEIPKLKLLFKDFSFSELTDKDTVDIDFCGKKFTVFISRLHDNNLPMLSFYFLDNTYYKNIETEYKERRPVVMSIMVDNIEMLSRELSDSRFALVISGLENIIEKWLNSNKVLFKNLSNGRFIVVGEKRVLDKLRKDKFSVLSLVKDYKYKGKTSDATLSIGVGCDGDIRQCEEKARKSLDLSLGRGGDQAVVLADDGYSYYGGMSDRMNDNSKVSPRQTAANISTLIKKYDRIFIFGHKFSDYDSVGAAVGFAYFCKKNGIDAKVLTDRKKTLALPLLEYLEKTDKKLFADPEEALKQCNEKTVAVVIDTHRPALLEFPEIFNKSAARIIIDHHRKMEDFISNADIFYHKPAQSSSCEMVTELLEYSENSGKILPSVATSLLSGIVLDTKNFVLRTSRSTFEAAAFLRDNSADTVAVKKLFSVKEEQVELKNSIISSAENYNGFFISCTEAVSPDLRVVSSKAADDLLNIDGVKASFVISQYGKDVNISARSLGEENVQLIMEKLGGGGHSTMAAAQIKDCDLKDAENRLKSAIEQYKDLK